MLESPDLKLNWWEIQELEKYEKRYCKICLDYCALCHLQSDDYSMLYTHRECVYYHTNITAKGSGDSLLVERRTRDRKVASLNPGGSGGRIFLLQSEHRVLTLIRCPFHTRVITLARKRPRSFYLTKSAGGRLHLNTHTPLTQRSRSGLVMQLSRHSVDSAPVVSARWATVDWTLHKEWN